ncbi:hypothetical protein B5M09_010714 [Aphanomyces astaci]|uniref:Uncharacterized protein n=1 Tax=Aphanomyces astaci TaxID=112090 RepID=A0A3R7WWW8_APHAT|nr:hypothetical protein B5M09_010714 [Aphanomyces astaci]
MKYEMRQLAKHATCPCGSCLCGGNAEGMVERSVLLLPLARAFSEAAALMLMCDDVLIFKDEVDADDDPPLLLLLLFTAPPDRFLLSDGIWMWFCM